MALRALVAAHANSAWNRSTRQLSKLGRNFALAFYALTWTVGTGGFAVAMGALGWASGTDWEDRGKELAGGTLFALSWGVGLLFGITGGGRLLEVGQLRQFPARPHEILFAELFARLAEPLTAAVAVGLFAFHVGLGVTVPFMLPRLAVLFPLLAFVMLAAQFVVGELLAATARRARLAIGVVVILALGFSPRVAQFFEAGGTLGSFQRIKALVRFFPTTRLLAAPAGGVEAALRLLEGLVGPALLLAAGMWVMGREQSGRAPQASERERGLWSFDDPREGIARLHLATLFRTPVGRYSLIAPLFAMVMVPWAMQVMFGTQRASLAVFLYAALGTVQFHFNLFGFDGPAAGELLRLPLTARQLFVGKHIAVLALALLEGAVLALFLSVVREESVGSCLSGLGVFLSVNLLMGTLGRFTSVQWPRTLPRSGMRGAAPPLPVVLVNLFGTLAITSTVGASHFFIGRYWASWLLPWSALCVVGCGALFVVTLGPAARFLDHRREHVLLSMK